MKRVLLYFLIGANAMCNTHLSEAPSLISKKIRIKDMVSVEGVRDNLLVGYGLVVGLAGSGDSLSGSPFTRESLVAMLERLGVNTRDKMTQMNTKNVAAVMVTANLPPFARQGTRIDVNISTMGDATNLYGGTLLVTSMIAADGNVYAVAQGGIVVSGINAGRQRASFQKNITTVGRIPEGGIVEKEAVFQLNQQRNLKLALRYGDFTTAKRIAQAINKKEKKNVASPLDSSTVQLHIPQNDSVVHFLSRIESIVVEPDSMAKVIINPNSGTIVISKNTVISPVAIAHGNLTIKIVEKPRVSQPRAFSKGRTQTLEDTQINVQEKEGKVAVMQGITLQRLVDNLNDLGVSVQDMLSIFQALKSVGALQASLEVQS